MANANPGMRIAQDAPIRMVPLATQQPNPSKIERRGPDVSAIGPTIPRLTIVATYWTEIASPATTAL